ncbi:MAG: hypothetical protein QHH10_01090 [Peptococcaceae bacterium]|jgi:phage FluMu protein Com|nr:hypothetical protein [Peptococcaceae bacterium]MDH7523890.1 hypothetical protein [Peptococcaceae bacterium]
MEAAYQVAPGGKSDHVRVTCGNCGKLLFKLVGTVPDKPVLKPARYIEIKCHNRDCKMINLIRI